MREVTLFIAMSLDGYLADESGGVGWLEGQGTGKAVDSYGEFVKGVDTVVMGWKTYHQIVTELSPEEWAYPELSCYVITHRRPGEKSGIVFTGEDPCGLVRRLKAERGRGIWICGGASVIEPLVQEDLIDTYHISVIPTLLGGGIRLFGPRERERRLSLVKMREGDGIAELVYQRRGQRKPDQTGKDERPCSRIGFAG